MRSCFLPLLLAATTFVAPCAHASKILPDACGPNKISFDVDIDKDQPSLIVPKGKSVLVFISTVIGLFPPPIRYGVDGTWAGAAKNKSYITYVVDPGEHHLCYSGRSFVGAKSVTTEAGKVYFFEFHFAAGYTPGPRGGVVVPSQETFTQLEEDQGKFLVKSYAHATFTPNK